MVSGTGVESPAVTSSAVEVSLGSEGVTTRSVPGAKVSFPVKSGTSDALPRSTEVGGEAVASTGTDVSAVVSTRTDVISVASTITDVTAVASTGTNVTLCTSTMTDVTSVASTGTGETRSSELGVGRNSGVGSSAATVTNKGDVLTSTSDTTDKECRSGAAVENELSSTKVGLKEVTAVAVAASEGAVETSSGKREEGRSGSTGDGCVDIDSLHSMAVEGKRGVNSSLEE